MQPRLLVQALAAARFGVGVFMLVRPQQAMRSWIGDDASRPRTQMLIRSFGARDGMLGLGALMAMRRGTPARGWVEAGVACDVVDFVGTLAMMRRLPKLGAYVVLATAATAIAIGLYAGPRLAEDTKQASDEQERLIPVAD